MNSVMTPTPNQAMTRTAPGVTAPASVAAFPPAIQMPRRTPPSLSLGSGGAFRIRAIQASLFAGFAALLCSCGGDRRIDLDSALRSTSQGDFTIIVFTDQFISFQRDGFHKYQYYFTPPLPQTIVDQITSAAAHSRSKKHEVQIEDIRASHAKMPSA